MHVFARKRSVQARVGRENDAAGVFVPKCQGVARQTAESRSLHVRHSFAMIIVLHTVRCGQVGVAAQTWQAGFLAIAGRAKQEEDTGSIHLDRVVILSMYLVLLLSGSVCFSSLAESFLSRQAPFLIALLAPMCGSLTSARWPTCCSWMLTSARICRCAMFPVRCLFWFVCNSLRQV